MVKQKIGPTMLWTVELLGVVLLLAGSSGQRLLITVSEAWAKAEALDGKLVRVRGRGRFFTVPYQGLTGCVPGGGSAMVGQLALYDEGAPDPRYYGKKQPLPKIVLSESSLQCKGNTCYLKCTPFKPEEARLYEFVGTLRIGEQQGKRVLLLGDIDLDGSRRLVEEKWEAIKREEFDNFVFP